MKEQHKPIIAVSGLVFNPEGKLLLVKTHKWNGCFIKPGGRVEFGETAEQALKREMLEETGLKVSSTEFVSFQESIFDNLYWKKKHLVCLNFACKTKSSKVVLNDEAQEFVWVFPKQAFKLLIDHYTREALKEFLKKKG